MELIELIKQFARRQYLVVSHYPREHLYIAGALGGLFLILLALPMGAEDDAVDGRTEIALEIDLNRSAAASDQAPQAVIEPAGELSLSDFVITPVEKEATPVLEDVTVWQNIEVKSGDNLSAIFSKVGLSDQDLFRILNSCLLYTSPSPRD